MQNTSLTGYTNGPFSALLPSSSDFLKFVYNYIVFCDLFLFSKIGYGRKDGEVKNMMPGKTEGIHQLSPGRKSHRPDSLTISRLCRADAV